MIFIRTASLSLDNLFDLNFKTVTELQRFPFFAVVDLLPSFS